MLYKYSHTLCLSGLYQSSHNKCFNINTLNISVIIADRHTYYWLIALKCTTKKFFCFNLYNMLSIYQSFFKFSVTRLTFFFYKRLKLFSVVRSPFVYKKTKEHFNKAIYKVWVCFTMTQRCLLYQSYLFHTFSGVALKLFNMKLIKILSNGTTEEAYKRFRG